MPKFFSELSDEIRYELIGIALTTVGLLSLISLFSPDNGTLGTYISKMLQYSLGMGAPVFPVMIIIVGTRYIWMRCGISYSARFWGLFMLYLCLLAFIHIVCIPVGQEILPESLIPGGGLIGGLFLFVLRKLVGNHGAWVFLLSFSVCGMLLATMWSLREGIDTAREKTVDHWFLARKQTAASEQSTSVTDWDRESFFDQNRQISRQHPEAPLLLPAVTSDQSPILTTAKDTEEFRAIASNLEQVHVYTIPPLSILTKNQKPRSLKMQKELVDNAKLLEETLANFGVGARIINTCQGPTITRYELEPAPGVKVSKIVNLADDIALKLAASGVRIEAPIPGKAAVGIEVPNKEVSSVPLREVLESSEFQQSASPLTVALGKDIAGKSIVADLSKMPHLLVAGSTGSGKSVCINTIITSLLFKARPNQVKFILIDPKMVELSNYNGIPHLMSAVVTDPQKAATTLRWAVQEMERRYSLFAETGVRDIQRYNEMHQAEAIPWVVIIIDELADLMMVAPVDVEDAICRLAQKARAAGLHLVLATQRPSVDVITGTIKANIPSRIAFAVSSQVDSRTILDMGGAEKLVGKGDMLFSPIGSNKPIRIQGAFISDQEVEALIHYVKMQGEPKYLEEIASFSPEEEKKQESAPQDEMLEEAVRVVMETGQASVSMLQRKFRIGYTRAARLIDAMEEMKIVGPNIGSKPREILMTSDQVYGRYFKS
nr:DNA translocase FtsK [Acetonema longum]